MARSRAEDQIHCAIADLLRLKARKDVLWLHIPNERDPTQGAGRLKKMGVLPGAADFLFVFRDGQAAFLEIKAPKGRQSPAQVLFEAFCAELMIPYAVVRSLREAEFILGEWRALRGPVERAKAA